MPVFYALSLLMTVTADPVRDNNKHITSQILCLFLLVTFSYATGMQKLCLAKCAETIICNCHLVTKFSQELSLQVDL